MTTETLDLSKLVEDYGEFLYRYAYTRVGNRELAEDLVQDTFLSAIQNQATFRSESLVKTWLCTILKNKIIDHTRRCFKEQPMTESADEEGELDAYFNKFGAWRGWFFKRWSSCPLEVLENKGFAAQLSSCLGKLPERFRHVFMLRMVDELNPREICEAAGISESNLGVIMFRSRMQLRNCLEENWFKPARTGGR